MPGTHHRLRRDLASALAEFLEPEEAQAECVRWFEDGFGLSRAWLAVHGAEPVPEAREQQVATWLLRRRAGEPWAYLLGWTWFRDRRFELSPATLIPRPETELPARFVVTSALLMALVLSLILTVTKSLTR